MDGHRQREESSQHPGEWRIEQEARLARVPRSREDPVRIEGSVTHLVGGIEPALNVEDEVMSTGVPVMDQRQRGNQRGKR